MIHKLAINDYRDIKAGKLYLKDAAPDIQSWFRIEVFIQASFICEQKDIETRRKLIADIPETYREEVKAEVLRLWKDVC